MKTIFNLFVVFISLFLFSCRTAQVAVSDDLTRDASVYAVKGRQGFRIGQVLSFGAYETSKVNRGWTFSYAVPFVLTFQGAREKLSFTQYGPAQTLAEVSLISRFRSTELGSAERYFALTLTNKNYAAGNVRVLSTDKNWEFMVHNVDGPNRMLRKNATAGFIRTPNTQIEILGIRELEGSPRIMTQNQVYGYEFRLDGEVIGAVSTINNGQVWFKNDLSSELKLVLASVSSGLMLRDEIQDDTVAKAND